MEAESRLADRYVDGTYLDANPSWHEEDAAAKARWVVDLLAAHPGLPLESMCDVGCGTGGVLDHVRHGIAADIRVTGFEPSADAVHIAQSKHPTLLIVERCATADDGPFDVALVLDVFEHIADYLGFLRGLQGVARNYVFLIPLDMTVYNLIRPRELMRLRRTLGHLHHFSPQTALSTLSSTGYDVLDWRFVLVAGSEKPRLLRLRAVRWIRHLAWKLAPDLSARMIGGVSLLVLANGEARPT